MEAWADVRGDRERTFNFRNSFLVLGRIRCGPARGFLLDVSEIERTPNSEFGMAHVSPARLQILIFEIQIRVNHVFSFKLAKQSKLKFR